MKPKLLVVELWGLGDLVIATPFLQAASQRYDVTLLAKPYAQDLQRRFWPGIQVVPFVAPWTAFTHKYRLRSWPWKEIFKLRHLAREHFDVGLSARWDPRDHFLLAFARAQNRVGFPRLGSQIFLTQPLDRPSPRVHRYEHWRFLGQTLELELPARERLPLPPSRRTGDIVVHTGAGQPVRVWPLERYRNVIARLRSQNLHVRVVCDPDQEKWWREAGEKNLAAPETVAELFELLDQASLFIGNDSGPGHLAAFCGVPTFTVFGPQLPEWFAPLHPASYWMEGKACPYKPCSDYCRFSSPVCLWNISEEEFWAQLELFLNRQLALHQGLLFPEERQQAYQNLPLPRAN